MEKQLLLKAVEMARARFLYGLDKVPDDRLAWSPGGVAKTPLELAGKLAGFLGFIGHLARTGEMPQRAAAPPPAPATRDEAKAALDAAFGRIREAIEALTDEELARQVPAPWGERVALREMIGWLPTVLGYHQGQLNYLQMVWGDADPNIPPEWFQASASGQG